MAIELCQQVPIDLPLARALAVLLPEGQPPLQYRRVEIGIPYADSSTGTRVPLEGTRLIVRFGQTPRHDCVEVGGFSTLRTGYPHHRAGWDTEQPVIGVALTPIRPDRTVAGLLVESDPAIWAPHIVPDWWWVEEDAHWYPRLAQEVWKVLLADWERATAPQPAGEPARLKGYQPLALRLTVEEALALILTDEKDGSKHRRVGSILPVPTTPDGKRTPLDTISIHAYFVQDTQSDGVVLLGRAHIQSTSPDGNREWFGSKPVMWVTLQSRRPGETGANFRVEQDLDGWVEDVWPSLAQLVWDALVADWQRAASPAPAGEPTTDAIPNPSLEAFTLSLNLNRELACSEVVAFYESCGGSRAWPDLRQTSTEANLLRLVLGGDDAHSPAHIDFGGSAGACKLTIAPYADRASSFRLDDPVRGPLDGHFGLAREPDPLCVEFCGLLAGHLAESGHVAPAGRPDTGNRRSRRPSVTAKEVRAEFERSCSTLRRQPTQAELAAELSCDPDTVRAALKRDGTRWTELKRSVELRS